MTQSGIGSEKRVVKKMNKLIAIIDNEPDIVELISLHLKKSCFKVKGFFDAESFYRFLDEEIADLIILDLMYPDTGGLDICKYIKKEDKYSSIPVIILSVKANETDKILGLEFGADDYITKLFSPRELVARVKIVFRKRQKA